jgi:sugar phosphate isomerase/epimerase
VLHFVIIQRTISTPHDYKIARLEFELFTRPSKFDFFRVHQKGRSTLAQTDLREHLPKSYKGTYPFRLGTTSFIYPDHYTPNVKHLGSYLDEIELLMFESVLPESLPESGEIKELARLAKDLDVTYNVHLPTDVSFGHPDEQKRLAAVDTIKKVIDLTAILSPSTCTLHLPYDRPSRDTETVAAWQRLVHESVGHLMDKGVPGRLISIETLDYPFDWVKPIIVDFDLSVCLDLGHLMIYGYDMASAFEQYADRTAVIHLHGVEDGQDHIALDRLSAKQIAAVMRILQQYTGTVSMEVFCFEHLKKSLAFLEKCWNA